VGKEDIRDRNQFDFKKLDTSHASGTFLTYVPGDVDTEYSGGSRLRARASPRGKACGGPAAPLWLLHAEAWKGDLGVIREGFERNE
jgi:hypothetical protein